MPRRSLKAEQVEEALLAEIDRLEMRIARVRAQQNALKAALTAHRLRKLHNKGAIRKNSFTRLVAERRVIDRMKGRSGATPVAQLYAAVNRGHEDEPMPASTFRSLLHRMKAEGLIVGGYARGTYALPPPKTN